MIYISNKLKYSFLIKLYSWWQRTPFCVKQEADYKPFWRSVFVFDAQFTTEKSYGLEELFFIRYTHNGIYI